MPPYCGTSDLSRATRFHYVDHSTRFVNWLEGKYAPRVTQRPGPLGWAVSSESRSKYAPLRKYLETREDENAIRLTFRRIEDGAKDQPLLADIETTARGGRRATTWNQAA